MFAVNLHYTCFYDQINGNVVLSKKPRMFVCRLRKDPVTARPLKVIWFILLNVVPTISPEMTMQFVSLSAQLLRLISL